MLGEGIAAASFTLLGRYGFLFRYLLPYTNLFCYISIVETLQKKILVEKSFRRIFLSPIFLGKSLIRR